MNYENNIGLCFSANYLKQGSNSEKCKLANKNHISNISLKVREDKNIINYSENSKLFNGNIIYSLPSISYNLNNQKKIENIISDLVENKVKMITINPTNLILSDYEWSTDEEKETIFKNITESIASLVSNKIIVALENPIDKKDKIYFGHDIEEMTDIFVHVRKILVEEYKFTEEEVHKYFRICLNTEKLSETDMDKWVSSFNDAISIIKIKRNNKFDFIVNYIKTNKLNEDLIILLNTNSDLEDVINEYEDFKSNFSVKKKKTKKMQKNKDIKKDNSSDKYANMVQMGIIIITIFIIILMIYVKFKS